MTTARKLSPKEMCKLFSEEIRELFPFGIMFEEPKTLLLKGVILTSGKNFLDEFQAMHDVVKTASKLYTEDITPECLAELKEKLQKINAI